MKYDFHFFVLFPEQRLFESESWIIIFIVLRTLQQWQRIRMCYIKQEAAYSHFLNLNI